MAATVMVNGRIGSERDAVISVFDHGFLYGEGVYETMRTYGGRPFLYDRHMRRLRRSSAMIALAVPFSDDELAGRIRETTEAAGLGGAEAYIRVLLTRAQDLSFAPRPGALRRTPSHGLHRRACRGWSPLDRRRPSRSPS